MMWIQSAWLVGGCGLGILHAVGIWRSALQPTAATALWGGLRLLAIGLVLAAAAIFGGILPTAVGWTLGFLAGVLFVLVGRLGAGPARAASWAKRQPRTGRDPIPSATAPDKPEAGKVVR